MKIFDIFSKLLKKLRGKGADVYQHETIPKALRNQVIFIWEAVFGQPAHQMMGGLAYPGVYELIHNELCRRHGLRTLKKDDYASDFDAIYKFFLETEDTEKVIDVIEISFQCIDHDRSFPYRFSRQKYSPDDAIAELNDLFQKHGVEYRYESGQIICVDSEFTHSEVVKPALIMLSDSMYAGANDEFLNAHKHYRAGNYKECMNECLKAFESCIKSICDARGWGYSNRATAKNLIDLIFKNKLIPNSMQSHFSGLRSTLETVGTLRNDHAHGQGSTVITVPEYMAAYALHLTASNILFLAKANEEME